MRYAAGLLAVGLLSLAATATAQPLFLLDSDVDGVSSLYQVNPATGEMTLIGSFDVTPGEATGLAADGAGTLYASTLVGDIIRLTVAPSFTATPLGNVRGALTAMHFGDGGLYVVDEQTDELAFVRLDPLGKTVIGKVRVGAPMGPVLDIIGGDISRDRFGNWYLFTNSTNAPNSQGRLFQLDVTTAVANEIGPTVWEGGRITGMVFDDRDGGMLYVSARDQDSLISIDPRSGCAIGSVPLCSSCPAPFDVLAGDLAAVESLEAPAPTDSAPTASTSLSGAPSGGSPCMATGYCIGDCDRNGRVAIDEMIRGVNIALDRQSVGLCLPFDRNTGGTVTIDELMRGISNALGGCRAE